MVQTESNVPLSGSSKGLDIHFGSLEDGTATGKDGTTTRNNNKNADIDSFARMFNNRVDSKKDSN